MSTNNQPATSRIPPKKQTLEDAYSPPANFLEIDITDPQTHGLPKSKGRYTDYAVKMKVHVHQFYFKPFPEVFINHRSKLDFHIDTARLTIIDTGHTDRPRCKKQGTIYLVIPITCNLNFLFLCINVIHVV